MKGLKPGKVIMDFIFQAVFNEVVMGFVDNIVAFILGMLGFGS